MYDGLDLFESLLPSLFNLNKFFFHLYLKLIFHLINMGLKSQYFLLHSILPTEFIDCVLFPVIFDHRKYFFLELLDFTHHFLFSLSVNLSSLRNKISNILLVAGKSAFSLTKMNGLFALCFSIMRWIARIN